MSIKIVGISDTHGSHWDVKIPDGDILVVAGDFCNRGTMTEILDFNAWLGTLPHKNKIVTAGNHDRACVGNANMLKLIFSNAKYLEHEAITIDGINFFASPWTPAFNNWYFMYEKNSTRATAIWGGIPENTHVLVTHGPPARTSLSCLPSTRLQRPPEDCGCAVLRARIEELKNLRLTVHGHIHEGWGLDTVKNVTCLNVSALDGNYDVAHEGVTYLY